MTRPGTGLGRGAAPSGGGPAPSLGRPRLGADDKSATDAEVHAILEWLAQRATREARRLGRRGPRQRDLALVALIAGTGLRVSEAAALQRRDLQLGERPYVRVRGGKGRDGRDADTVPLAWDTAHLLRRWVEPLESMDPVFQAATSARRLDRREVWQVVKRAVRALGLRDVLNAHSLRHWFITRVARRSRSSATVARLARLRSPRLVDTYVHVALEDVAAIQDQLTLPGLNARRRRAIPPGGRPKRRG